MTRRNPALDAAETLIEAREWLTARQHAVCAYGTTEGDGHPCDCKALGIGRPSSEQTGCVELRRAIWALAKQPRQ